MLLTGQCPFWVSGSGGGATADCKSVPRGKQWKFESSLTHSYNMWKYVVKFTMKIKDIYDTRFNDDLKIIVMKKAGNLYRNIYDGMVIDTPISILEINVDILKPISLREFYVFVK